MIGTEVMLTRLVLASLFGALIGLERERKDWAAGLRTHMLVCVGSCLIMIVSAYGFSDILGTENVELDPSRIAAQVVSGIGFIGAGTILFQRGGTVRGLTTAAGLWTVAAIGLATGGGLYWAAGATTVIALIILWVLNPLERYYGVKFRKMTLRVVAEDSIGTAEMLNELVDQEQLQMLNFTMEREGKQLVFLLRIKRVDDHKADQIVNDLQGRPGIKEISWTR